MSCFYIRGTLFVFLSLSAGLGGLDYAGLCPVQSSPNDGESRGRFDARGVENVRWQEVV